MPKRSPEDGQASDFYMQRQEDVLNDLDPHLQEMVLAHRAGEAPNPRIVSTVAGKLRVDVIAKLKDPGQPVPGLEVVSAIGKIVTGSVAIPDIESVRRHDNVQSLKAATRVYSTLATSLNEVRCDAETLRGAFPDLGREIDGKEVILGIVDEGCAFRHGNFRDDSGSRLLFLWDQRERNFTARRPVRATARAPRPFGYGREFDRARLNAALRAQDPYQEIDYELHYDPQSTAHGTHVMDIAAGNGNESGQPGVAPKADLIFVHVDVNDVSDEESLGNSRRLLEAVNYIFKKADALGRPAVVNISLGTDGGPHDGTTLVEEALDEMVSAKPGRAIVVAAGNSHDRRSHAMGVVRSSQPARLSWELRPNPRIPTSEMEIWYSGDASLEITLTDPNGAVVGSVPLGETHEIWHKVHGRMGQIAHRRADPNNGDHQIDLLLQRYYLPEGTWTVELTTRDRRPVEFHAWIERDDTSSSMFAADQADPSHTLGSISCGKHTLVVGAYNAKDRRLSTFTSAGPTRDGREKPELSAPGLEILAASSRGGTTNKSGTSMAAPHVAGLIALLFQVGGPLSIGEVRKALEASVRRKPPAGDGHDSRYGSGRIDGVAALRAVSSAVVPPLKPPQDLIPGAEVLVPQPLNGHSPLPALLSQMLSGTFRISVKVEQVGPL